MSTTLRILREAGLVDDDLLLKVEPYIEVGFNPVVVSVHFGLDARSIAELLAEKAGEPRLDIVRTTQEAVDLVSPAFLYGRGAIPLKLEARRLVVGMVDPFDMQAMTDLEAVTGRTLVPRTIEVPDFMKFIESISDQTCDEFWDQDSAYWLPSREHLVEALTNIFLIETIRSREKNALIARPVTSTDPRFRRPLLELLSESDPVRRIGHKDAIHEIIPRLRFMSETNPSDRLGGVLLQTGDSRLHHFILEFGEDEMMVVAEHVDEEEFVRRLSRGQ